MTPAMIYSMFRRNGRPVVLRRIVAGAPVDATVMAVTTGDDLDATMGDRPMSQRTLALAAADPGLAGWPLPIVDGDHVIDVDGTFRVFGCEPLYIGAAPARFNIIIKGPV